MNGKAVLIIVIASIFFLVAILFLPVMFLINSISAEDPDVTYAEFPIEITYEIDGEVLIVNEIFVVKYAGFDGMLGPTWRGYVQSTGEEGIILYHNNDVKVICELGDADYYIGKTGRYKDDIVPPNVYQKEEKPWFLFFKGDSITKLTESDLLEMYGIKIINWSTEKPLDNYWEMINL